MTRQVDVAFSALVALDPIRHAQGTDGPDPLTVSPDALTDAHIARILAMPRRDHSGECRAREQRGRSGTPRRSRSRCGVLGLVVSAAAAIAATLLWVTPSAGAPSRQAITAGVHAIDAIDAVHAVHSHQADLPSPTAAPGTFTDFAPHR